jgi:hypothetical protein
VSISRLGDSTRTTFEWTLDGAFLLQRWFVPAPEAPNGLCMIGPDPEEGYTQHYFNSRGVARLYAMTFDGREWTLERNAPDFSPLDFHQRWLGRSAPTATGSRVAGRARRTAGSGSSTSSSSTTGRPSGRSTAWRSD